MYKFKRKSDKIYGSSRKVENICVFSINIWSRISGIYAQTLDRNTPKIPIFTYIL